MTAKTMLLLFKWMQYFQHLRANSIHHPTNIDIHRRDHWITNQLLILQAFLQTAPTPLSTFQYNLVLAH